MADDFNLPNAITYTLDLVKEGNQVLRNKEVDLEKLKDIFYALNTIIYILGLSINPKILTEDDKHIFLEYQEAKLNKDFAKSDNLRKILIDKNIL